MAERVQREKLPERGLGFRLGPVSWVPATGLERSQWLAAGRRIGAMGRASGWWIGDWLTYGAKRWGERYAEAARVTGYDTHSLRNMAYVASRFDLSLRRDNLSWSHHAALAALDRDQREVWLDRAIAERLSVADLRKELRAYQRGLLDPEPRSGHSKQTPKRSEDCDVCPSCGRPLPADAIRALEGLTGHV